MGCATAGSLMTKTALSLIETVRLNPDLEIQPIFCYSGYIGENKANIVDTAQKLLCSHVFFVDHDMEFPPNLLPKLLSTDEDIIGGMYYYKQMPLDPMLKYFKPDGEWTPKIEESTLKEIPNEIFEIAATGGGMLLVKMSVFNKIKRPYFAMEQDEFGKRSMTEDCGFFIKAQAKGYKVMCDPTIRIGHVGNYTYGSDKL